MRFFPSLIYVYFQTVFVKKSFLCYVDLQICQRYGMNIFTFTFIRINVFEVLNIWRKLDYETPAKKMNKRNKKTLKNEWKN